GHEQAGKLRSTPVVRDEKIQPARSGRVPVLGGHERVYEQHYADVERKGEMLISGRHAEAVSEDAPIDDYGPVAPSFAAETLELRERHRNRAREMKPIGR